MIVVGTDGSETASAAVALAADLARQSGGTLHLVTAFKSTSGVGGGGIAGGDPASGEGFSQLAAEGVLDKVKDQVDGVEVVLHAASGGAAAAIVNVADEVGRTSSWSEARACRARDGSSARCPTRSPTARTATC